MYKRICFREGKTLIRVILWDIDNTLLSFDAAEKAALYKEFEEFELGEFNDEMLQCYVGINRKYWQALERGELTKPEVLVGRFVEFFKEYQLPVEKAPAFNERYQVLLGDTICFHDDAYNIVKSLKGKMLQCAASNGTKVAQVKKLKNSGLDQLFELIFISEDVGAEKPSIEFFDKVLGEASNWLIENEANLENAKEYRGALNLSEVIIVGDSLTSDILGGNNAGIRTCWYNPKGLINDTNAKVDYEIKDLHEVFDLIK